MCSTRGNRDPFVVVGVAGLVGVAGRHRGNGERQHEQARHTDCGNVKTVYEALSPEERDRSADRRNCREERGQRVFKPDRFHGSERSTDVGDTGQHPHGDAACIQQDTGGDDQPVGAQYDGRRPADLRHRAECKEPRKGGFVAVGCPRPPRG